MHYHTHQMLQVYYHTTIKLFKRSHSNFHTLNKFQFIPTLTFTSMSHLYVLFLSRIFFITQLFLPPLLCHCRFVCLLCSISILVTSSLLTFSSAVSLCVSKWFIFVFPLLPFIFLFFLLLSPFNSYDGALSSALYV